MPTRRKTLIGLANLIAGGMIVGTDAVAGVTLDETVDFSIVVVNDLRLEPGRDDGAYVEEDDDGLVTSISIDAEAVDGTNQRARSRFEHIVDLVNNGDVPVEELYFEFDVEGDHPSVDEEEIEAALNIVSATDSIPGTGENDFLEISEAEDVEDSQLGPGDSVPWGVEVDLLPETDTSDIQTLPDPDDFDITLSIIAMQ